MNNKNLFLLNWMWYTCGRPTICIAPWGGGRDKMIHFLGGSVGGKRNSFDPRGTMS